MKTKQTGLSTFETLAGGAIAAILAIGALTTFSKADKETTHFTTNQLTLVEQLEAGHIPCIERTQSGAVLCRDKSNQEEK